MITGRTSDTFRRRRRQVTAMSFAAPVLVLTAAGCTSHPGRSAGSAPVPRATGDPVSAQPIPLGTILVDGAGRTVYDFANDKTISSTCTTAACVAIWPFVPAPASLPAALPGVTGAPGSTTRPDGAHQLTVAGHPVYIFAGDSAPGQTNGQGQILNGGLWTVVSPPAHPSPTPARPATPRSPPAPATRIRAGPAAAGLAPSGGMAAPSADP